MWLLLCMCAVVLTSVHAVFVHVCACYAWLVYERGTCVQHVACGMTCAACMYMCMRVLCVHACGVPMTVWCACEYVWCGGRVCACTCVCWVHVCAVYVCGVNCVYVWGCVWHVCECVVYVCVVQVCVQCVVCAVHESAG